MTLAAPISRQTDSASKAWLRALEMTARIEERPARIFPAVIEELGARFGDAPALIDPRQTFSHAQLAARANRYARWALSENIAKGDVVCLLLPNSCDYLAAWLGITRIGAIAALLNINLRGPALAHCIRVAAPKHILIAPALAPALDDMAMNTPLWWHGDAFGMLLDSFSGEALADAEQRDVTLDDRALLIYTSGTTGLPKAAHVSHRRVMNWTHWFAGMTGARADDRLYNCLPMYHSVGGVVASGAMLLAGGAVILREKFSASAFWRDVTESGATIFQYIGELCRYLLAGTNDVPAHTLRLAVGNGLSGDVWEKFVEKCSSPPPPPAERTAGEMAVAGPWASEGRRAPIQILEFYAATEGNFSLYNAEGRPGAIGRIPPFLAHRFPTAIVRFDAESGLPARGADGLCLRAGRGETGEAIGKIAGGAARFEGYTDAGANEKKILRDVFVRGDAWLRSGDLMRQDAAGFFYFIDRIGDTFRWKGENVATTEVAAVAAAAPGVRAVHIYGVPVPGQDGKCGMAALDVAPDFDLENFRAHLASQLPAYARPVFLRVMAALDITETFKPKKQALALEGFDPEKIVDPLYADCGAGYVPLDAALYARISSGLMRL